MTGTHKEVRMANNGEDGNGYGQSKLENASLRVLR